MATNSSTPSVAPLSSRAHAVIGFVVAGAALVALADVAPQAAIGLTAVIGLGVLLTHGAELQQLSSAFASATGHAPSVGQSFQAAGGLAGGLLG